MKNISQPFNYNHLSVKDLVEARDLFHVHLINKRNVVATAIGRYLIRTSDIDKNGRYAPQKTKPPRTLQNSVVIDISWPCILVFVDSWEDTEELAKRNASDIVSKEIFLPDGRIVPICVVYAPKLEKTNTTVSLSQIRFPDNVLGGGFPVYIKSQGETQIATIGCIVTDGHTYYALTNKHVTGDANENIYTIQGNSEVKIGNSVSKTLGKIPFSVLYENWESKHIIVSCDAGLFRIDNINDWKTDVLGIGTMGTIIDINTRNLTLGLLAEHDVINGKRLHSKTGNVVGYGAYSKKVEGEILALFYRYKSVGGKEYVSDFVIQGRNGQPLSVQHGDSGFLWHLELKETTNKTYHPIALHWGQHQIISNSVESNFSFSLSTSVSNICRELDVEIVRGWNIDNDYSWGKLGHYKIAAKACEIVTNKKLKKLLMANQGNISFTDTDIENGLMKELNSDTFCALADVPDIVWRKFRKLDDANHFADMDESYEEVMNGKSLMDLCKNNEKNVDIDFWNDFYQQLEDHKQEDKPAKRGALPFRIWQAFNLMVGYLKQKKVAEFICIGGIVSHYLGDACQPLHISHLHHGTPGKEDEIDVHSVYETKMLDRYNTEVLTLLNSKFNDPKKYVHYQTGRDAAFATIKMMNKIISKILSPEEIIDVFNETGGRGRIPNMWDKLHVRTINTMTEGTLNLGLFWESAWKEGNGDALPETSLKKISETKLMELYNNKLFFPAYRLKDPLFKDSLL